MFGAVREYVGLQGRHGPAVRSGRGAWRWPEPGAVSHRHGEAFHHDGLRLAGNPEVVVFLPAGSVVLLAAATGAAAGAATAALAAEAHGQEQQQQRQHQQHRQANRVVQPFRVLADQQLPHRMHKQRHLFQHGGSLPVLNSAQVHTHTRNCSHSLSPLVTNWHTAHTAHKPGHCSHLLTHTQHSNWDTAHTHMHPTKVHADKTLTLSHMHTCYQLKRVQAKAAGPTRSSGARSNSRFHFRAQVNPQWFSFYRRLTIFSGLVWLFGLHSDPSVCPGVAGNVSESWL